MSSNNKGKGGKTRRRGKNKSEPTKREIVFKDESANQEYAKVDTLLGNCRVKLTFFDGRERLGIIPGAFKKRVWVNKEDIVLVSFRDYQDDRVDIIHKYNLDEAKHLIRKGEIPSESKDEKKGDQDNGQQSIHFVSNPESGQKNKAELDKKRQDRVARSNNMDYMDTDMLPPTSEDESDEDNDLLMNNNPLKQGKVQKNNQTLGEMIEDL